MRPHNLSNTRDVKPDIPVIPDFFNSEEAKMSDAAGKCTFWY